MEDQGCSIIESRSWASRRPKSRASLGSQECHRAWMKAFTGSHVALNMGSKRCTWGQQQGQGARFTIHTM
eukprot:3324748-Pyramimonas_sp.AAC.1